MDTKKSQIILNTVLWILVPYSLALMLIFDHVYLKHWKHQCYYTHNYTKLSCCYCIIWYSWILSDIPECLIPECLIGRFSFSVGYENQQIKSVCLVFGSVYYRNSLVALFSALKCCNWNCTQIRTSCLHTLRFLQRRTERLQVERFDHLRCSDQFRRR